MEYLIARIQDSQVLNKVKSAANWPRMVTLGANLAVLHHNNFLCLLPSNAPRIGSKIILFDGHGVFGDHALSTSSDWAGHAGLLLNYVTQITNPAVQNPTASGVFSIVVVDIDNGSFDLVLDPFSQYNLFCADQSGITAYSNNLYIIEKAYQLAGRSLSRRLDVAGFEAISSVGAGNLTGIRGVLLTPSDYRIAGCFNKDEINQVGLKSLANRSEDRSAAKQRAINSLTRSVAAIHRSMSERSIVYDLTGGIDSRLVLASSRAAGLRDQLIFRSDGAPRHDTVIPDTIAAKFGLKYAGFPQNFDGECLTLWDLAKRAVFRQQGQSTIYTYELGVNRMSQVCRVRGGIGEIVRHFHKPVNLAKKRWRTKQALKSFLSPNGADRAHFCSYYTRDPLAFQASLTARSFSVHFKSAEFFTREFHAAVYRNIRDELVGLSESGVSGDTLLNAFYLSGRSRRHFGYASQMLNHVRPTFEPLANIDLWHYANAYSAEERLNCQVIFDLLQGLDEELLNMPICSSAAEKSSLGFNLAHEALPDIGRPPEVPVQTVAELQLAPDEAAKLEAYSGHAAHIMPLKNEFFELLFSFEKGHDVWRVLDRQAFMDLYASDEAATTIAAMPQLFMRLLYGLIWMADLEEPSAISHEI